MNELTNYTISWRYPNRLPGRPCYIRLRRILRHDRIVMTADEQEPNSDARRTMLALYADEDQHLIEESFNETPMM